MELEKRERDLIEGWADFFYSFQTQQTQMVYALFEEMKQPFFSPFGSPLNPLFLTEIFTKATQALAKNPTGLLKAQAELVNDTNNLFRKMLSISKNEPSTGIIDKRFCHEAWEDNPYFVFIKEYYLMSSRWLEKIVSEIEGLDVETIQKIQFYTKQAIEAASPTNSPFTNPEVIEEFVKTKGESLKNGLKIFLRDLKAGKWMQMTDPDAFQIGKTVASTKGEVIYRNHLFELIHYTPLTEQQYAIPLLIIPPWINKYYIFDLSPSNSFVKWILEQGLNVFIISWVNPGPELAHLRFEDYLDGAYQACRIISEFTGSASLHSMGFCVGGNLLTALNAYLAKAPALFTIKSMTLLATIFDFEKVGDLKVFMDEGSLQAIEKLMAQDGFLNGESLKSIFSLLRPKDLIWSFFIKNYFLGQVPPAFDFLYWNSDSTRLPESLHRFVLRNFFQKNLFIKPDALTINGIPLDIRNITTPTMLISTIEDHISPWESTYPAVNLFQGPVKFILAGSGHVAGIINPPSKNKYGFFSNPSFPSNAQEWFEGSIKNEGSWWTAWHEWVISSDSQKINPLMTYPFLESAPGSYVKIT